ncbi:hypothetical protein XSR1_620002 [Xenorhabdus szentirmaii DSM 16338]|uniref:Uncharacterized protein n=1 Tax=Xenorhabdus szentirmaii DSM 16338 TaxID=1427518 RepID=W1J5M7_9GAMM|nr:hypothetical protein XSR1_620002 [Xenorhabdus szentirmaii DSM 16338]
MLVIQLIHANNQILILTLKQHSRSDALKAKQNFFIMLPTSNRLSNIIG